MATTKTVQIDVKSSDFIILRSAIYCTWEMIASDYEAACLEGGEALDNECCIEGCIDAGRLGDFGNQPTAESILTKYLDEYEYKPLLKFLSKHVRLV